MPVIGWSNRETLVFTKYIVLALINCIGIRSTKCLLEFVVVCYTGFEVFLQLLGFLNYELFAYVELGNILLNNLSVM